MTLVALLGDPVAESLSPRMQNAAFAARALDWSYVACRVGPDGLDSAVRGLVALGFAGANVTIPHKQAVVGLCDEVEDDAARAGSVNTLVIRDGRILGSSTDAEILRGIEAGTAAVIGAGGAAAALVSFLRERGTDVRTFSRSADWPPSADGVELVVNATPVRDEALVAPVAGQVVVDLAYRGDGADTALVAAARAAGARVLDGLDVLVAQGAASFERWTGIAAPRDVMGAAVR